MKTNVINTASENVTSFVINEDMLNEKKAIKYISKPNMVAAINDLCAAIKPAQPLKSEEEVKEASKANKKAKADKAPKAEKKASVEGEKKSAPRVGDANERLTKYSEELAEKEALVANAEEFAKLSKEDAKAIRHRIASLKRKIERANKALGTK